MFGNISVSVGLVAIVILLSNIFLGVLVFSRNPKQLMNQTFLLFTIFLSLWASSSVISDGTQSYEVSKITAQLAFSFSFVGIICIWLFSSAFTGKAWMIRKTLALVSGLTIIFAALYGTKLVYHLTSLSTSEEGVLYLPYLLSMLVFFVLSLKNFLSVTRKGDAIKRSQARFIIFGFGVMVTSALITNAILPALISGTADALTQIGPLFTVFFTSSVALAIVRHKMFDIRLFVLRGLVYVFSIAGIAVLYSIIVYGIGSLFIDVSSVSYIQKVFFAVLALLIAVTYTPIVNFFNTITSRLFFRDAYSTPEVLDQIGKIIVGSIDLHKIQRSSLQVLSDAIRPNYMGFILKSGDGEIKDQDFIGDKPEINRDHFAKIIEKIGKHQTLFDELEQSTESIAQFMRESDITLITPLITKNESIGYLIAGPKKSGNIFNNQDKSMLTIAANELAVALQNAQRFEEIQAFNITLQEKVDEATKELKKTNRKLVELDEAKDEFISMASHQLRTPLTSIKGYISMLMEGDLGKVSKEQDQALKEAFTSSQRMVFLISDFLNVSRIKTGKFVIEPKEVDLSDMVTQELVQLREMADAKKLKMVYEPPSQFPTVKLDDNKMHQVMMNMIDNAIYYTPNEGTITIQLYIDGKDVVFKVVDTGIGVPKAEQHKLFTKFFRAGNARKTRPDGTGLGLFMAQKVVVAQGGSIIFESIEGKGSTFGFRFTLSSIKA